MKSESNWLKNTVSPPKNTELNKSTKLFKWNKFHNFKVIQVLRANRGWKWGRGQRESRQVRMWADLVCKQPPRGWAPWSCERILTAGRRSSPSCHGWPFSGLQFVTSWVFLRETKGTSNYRQLQGNTAPNIRITTSEAKNKPALSHKNEKQMSCSTKEGFLHLKAFPNATSVLRSAGRLRAGRS